MRFEIRAGGAFAILVGLGLLSGSVFLLGLVAGYEMGQQQQESNRQFATVYPLQAPGATAPGATAPGAARRGRARVRSPSRRPPLHRRRLALRRRRAPLRRPPRKPRDPSQDLC